MRRLQRACFFVLAVATSPLSAAGVEEEVFSQWYDSALTSVGDADVANTGLTVFPTLTIPVGGEIEALGTAYTAAARDASFIDANPAASSRLARTELAIYRSNLIADTNMDSLAYTTRLADPEDLGVGFGVKYLQVPFTSYDDFGVAIAGGRYTEAIAAVNLAYNFLSSFYFSGVSLGVNAKLAYRGVPESIAPNQSAVGVMADVGVLTRFNALKFYSAIEPNTSIGIAIRNAGPPVRDEPLPTSAVFGIAWSPLRPWLIVADFGINIRPFTDTPAPPPTFALGSAVAVTDFFDFRAGFLMLGGNPRISMGGALALAEVELEVNYTLDLTTQLTAIDRFSIQASFNLGDRGRGARDDRVRELYLEAIRAFAVGDLETAIDATEEAISLDPSFEPAIETFEMVSRMKALQDQMESIRSLGGEEN